MTIVHLTFSFETGGLQTMLVDILNEQCQYNSVSLIIINDYYNADLLNEIDPRVRIVKFNRKPGSRNPILLLKLNGLLYRLDPMVVHCHNNELINMLIPHWYTTCLTVHDVNYPNRYFEKYDKVFAISEAVANDLCQRTSVVPEVIYNGIKADQLPVREQPLSLDPFRIVQIGRLVHNKKGQHIILHALAELIYGRGMTNLRVDFIGEGESIDFLAELTDTLGLRPYVTFLGLNSREYIYKRLKDYHLLVQPSLFEGFGLTVAEAMVAGVPVLVSAIEGPMEIIDNGQYGWYFPVEDSTACADQIEAIYQEYATVRFRQKVSRAREHARDVFNVKQTARRYILAY